MKKVTANVSGGGDCGHGSVGVFLLYICVAAYKQLHAAVRFWNIFLKLEASIDGACRAPPDRARSSQIDW